MKENEKDGNVASDEGRAALGQGRAQHSVCGAARRAAHARRVRAAMEREHGGNFYARVEEKR